MKELNSSETYIHPIVSVLTGQLFSTSQVLKVVNLGINQENAYSDKINVVNPILEEKINKQGSVLLEKILDEKDIMRYIKIFRDNANSFNPSTASGDSAHYLEDSLLNI